MANPEDDPNRSPDEPGESSDLGDMGADLQAALGDLLGGDATGDATDAQPDAPADDDGGDLDLHALEDAVAELGIDIVDDDPAEPTPPPSRPSPGLDLTEGPSTPPAPPGGSEPPARKLPPLGQASADDLFGPVDDDYDGGGFDGGGAGGEPSAPDLADLPPPPSGDDAGEPEPEPVSVSVPEPPAADPTSDEMVAYAAHRGRLTGEIAAKARKLFGR